MGISGICLLTILVMLVSFFAHNMLRKFLHLHVFLHLALGYTFISSVLLKTSKHKGKKYHWQLVTYAKTLLQMCKYMQLVNFKK